MNFEHTHTRTHTITQLYVWLGNSGRIEKLTASDDDATAGNCQLHGITVSCFVKNFRDSVELWDKSAPLGLIQDLAGLNANKIPQNIHILQTFTFRLCLRMLETPHL